MPRDDYDDRPRSDDDPPRPRPRRRRRDDDDDYDDRPRAKSGGSSVLLILGIVFGLLLCLGGGLVLLMLPAVARVRDAAARSQDQNHLKFQALGLHNEMSATDKWTVPYAHDERGKVYEGLSWRVGILPYIEQAPLYNSFDLTQAWDSPRNRPPSDTVVKEFATPFDDAPSAQTHYRVLVGGGALFEPDGRPIHFFDVQDGTSNTIMIVVAADQAPWAQPKELPYSPSAPLPKFGHPKQSGGFNVAMADGSVRFLTDKVSETTLRAAITKNGGEVLGTDW